MFSSELDYLVNKERHKDRLRELEHRQLIRAAGFQQSGNGRWLRKVANRVGAQLMEWSSKLQGYHPPYRRVLFRRR